MSLIEAIEAIFVVVVVTPTVKKVGSRLACVFFSGYFCCYDSERIDLEEIARSKSVKL